MFGGGDEHAFLHQARGVAHFGDVAAVGLDLITIKVNTAEDDAGRGGGGQDAQGNSNTAVKSYALTFDRAANCLLVYRDDSCEALNRDKYCSRDETLGYVVANIIDYRVLMNLVCGKSDTHRRYGSTAPRPHGLLGQAESGGLYNPLVVTSSKNS